MSCKGKTESKGTNSEAHVLSRIRQKVVLQLMRSWDNLTAQSWVSRREEGEEEARMTRYNRGGLRAGQAPKQATCEVSLVKGKMGRSLRVE